LLPFDERHEANRHASITPMAQMLLTTGTDCQLAIGRYPRFLYNASGGGGEGSLAAADANGWRGITLDPSTLTIPPLDWRSTRFLGLPLPPGLRIAIEPDELSGRWQEASGALELSFRARFRFTAFGIAAPELMVATRLTSCSVSSTHHTAQGRPLDSQGSGTVVGVALVPPTGNLVFDRFLGLPGEALALLHCRISS
jgi:hypothetical protein